MLVTRIFIRHCHQKAAREIKRASKILVMAGAGLSTPSRIPDFRTPGSGIYDNLKKYNLPYPEAIFDIHYFRAKPEPFYEWAKEFSLVSIISQMMLIGLLKGYMIKKDC